MALSELQWDEVSIGTVLLINGTVKRLNRKSFKWAICEWVGNDCDFIPLTPDILTMLGFSNNTYGGFMLSTDEEVDFRWIRIFFDINGIIDTVQYNDEYIMGECKYLHQLQRLYAMVSGKKLEIDIVKLQELLNGRI